MNYWGETECPIPPVEFGRSLTGAYAVTPVLELSTCEQTEKERIIRLDAYTLTVTLNVPEYPEGAPFGSPNSDAENQGFSAVYCYTYAWAVDTALGDDPTLGGAAGRAVLTGKKYAPSRQSGSRSG
jgi:hypothetical protein